MRVILDAPLTKRLSTEVMGARSTPIVAGSVLAAVLSTALIASAASLPSHPEPLAPLARPSERPPAPSVPSPPVVAPTAPAEPKAKPVRPAARAVPKQATKPGPARLAMVKPSALPEATDAFCKELLEDYGNEDMHCPHATRVLRASQTPSALAWHRRYGTYRAAWLACKEAIGQGTRVIYETREMTAERRRRDATFGAPLNYTPGRTL